MTSKIALIVAATILVFLNAIPIAVAEGIIGWRTDGTGRYPDASPPTHWSDAKNVVWRTSLPGNGYGSPIVVSDRIFVVSEPAELLCLRFSDGSVVWQRTHRACDLFGEEKAEKIEEEYTALRERRKLLQHQLGDARKERSAPTGKLDRLATAIDANNARLDALMDTYPPPIKRGGAGNAASTPVSDGESGRVKALELPETIGETVELETLWEGPSSRGRRTPSAVIQEGLLYAVNTSGILDITDAKTGVSMDRRRLDIGNVFSSATAAGNMIYLSGSKGTTVVIEAGQPHREVARNQLEGFGSSPVFIGERMYIRTQQHIYCICQ